MSLPLPLLHQILRQATFEAEQYEHLLYLALTCRYGKLCFQEFRQQQRTKFWKMQRQYQADVLIREITSRNGPNGYWRSPCIRCGQYCPSMYFYEDHDQRYQKELKETIRASMRRKTKISRIELISC